jgi:hypothetical protein
MGRTGGDQIMTVFAVVRSTASRTQVVSLHATTSGAAAAATTLNEAHKRGARFHVIAMTVHS